jgi:ribA/ribD-fused uncharacterized protein
MTAPSYLRVWTCQTIATNFLPGYLPAKKLFGFLLSTYRAMGYQQASTERRLGSSFWTRSNVICFYRKVKRGPSPWGDHTLDRYNSLSNYHPSSLSGDDVAQFFELKRVELPSMPTVEHYYQAFKFLYRAREDRYLQFIRLIAECDRPETAHALGHLRKTLREAKRPISSSTSQTLERAVDLYEDLVIDPRWEERKIYVMEGLVYLKFKHSDDLRKLLMSTRGKELVSFTYRERFWSSGIDHRGFNLLGQILTQVREALEIETRGRSATLSPRIDLSISREAEDTPLPETIETDGTTLETAEPLRDPEQERTKTTTNANRNPRQRKVVPSQLDLGEVIGDGSSGRTGMGLDLEEVIGDESSGRTEMGLDLEEVIGDESSDRTEMGLDLEEVIGDGSSGRTGMGLDLEEAIDDLGGGAVRKRVIRNLCLLGEENLELINEVRQYRNQRKRLRRAARKNEIRY